MALLALAVVAGAVLAFRRIGVDKVGTALLDSSPPWVLAGLGIMCASMAVRAVAWEAILKAALPDARVRLRDAMQGTFIGVLMSATLPARLGEPSRALIVARRTGRPREHFPIVLGTIVSQTLLNILALVLLGVVTLSSVEHLQRPPGRAAGGDDRAAGAAGDRADRAAAAERRQATRASRDCAS